MRVDFPLKHYKQKYIPVKNKSGESSKHCKQLKITFELGIFFVFLMPVLFDIWLLDF